MEVFIAKIGTRKDGNVYLMIQGEKSLEGIGNVITTGFLTLSQEGLDVGKLKTLEKTRVMLDTQMYNMVRWNA